jgi:type II secretory pathway predicted ATPase ExeA
VQRSQATTAAVRRAFSETVDPDGHVPRPATESRLDSLMSWCRSEGIGSTVAAIVAPPGIGKTHLLRVLEVRRLAEEAARDRGSSLGDVPATGHARAARRSLYLPYAALALPDLCQWVYGLLGVARPRVAASADADDDAMQALGQLGEGPTRPFFLLIDDADSMPSETLRALVRGLARERSPLRLVLALSDDSRATRMLAGLDSLRPLELPLREPLDEAETEAYLRARLARAGLGLEILEGLDRVTVTRIRALSGGIPRRIHRVVMALLEPERAALARALAMTSRTDAWLGQPIDDSL